MQSYYYNVEILRILSACSIIYFHAAPLTAESRKYGYVGLIIFLLISTTLSFIKKRAKQNFLNYAIKKANRILFPFLFWSIFYLLTSIYIKGLNPIIHKLSWTTILSGTYYHLWYLPFIYVVIIVSYFLNDRYLKIENSERNSEFHLLIGISLLILQAVVLNFHDLSTLAAQWLSSIPCFFFGIYLSKQLHRKKLDSNLISSKFPIAVGGISIAIHLLSTSSAVQMYAISYGLGALIFYLSFYLKRIPTSIVSVIKQLSNLTLGVYLIHPVIILMIIKFDLGLPLFFKYILILVFSFLATSIFKMIPFLKKIV